MSWGMKLKMLLLLPLNFLLFEKKGWVGERELLRARLTGCEVLLVKGASKAS